MTGFTDLEVRFFTGVAQAIFLAVMTVLVIGYAVACRRRTVSISRRGRDTVIHSRVGPSEELIRHLSTHISKGDVLIMPVGDGMYPTRIGETKRASWFIALKSWIRAGATVKVIISKPNDEVGRVWAEIADFAGERFQLIVLDKDTAVSAEDRAEITRLDTFHPVLLQSAGGTPIAMWIEHYHPIDEAEAHNVEFVGPLDTKHDERFKSYNATIQRLIRSAGRAVNLSSQDQHAPA